MAKNRKQTSRYETTKVEKLGKKSFPDIVR